MNNKGEHVLLYQFSDQARLEAVTRLLHHMNIRVTVLPDEAWKEKVGFLLGSRGFAAAKAAGSLEGGRAGTHHLQGGGDALQYVVDTEKTLPDHGKGAWGCCQGDQRA